MKKPIRIGIINCLTKDGSASNFTLGSMKKSNTAEMVNDQYNP
jgi:hypothetical protein